MDGETKAFLVIATVWLIIIYASNKWVRLFIWLPLFSMWTYYFLHRGGIS